MRSLSEYNKPTSALWEFRSSETLIYKSYLSLLPWQSTPRICVQSKYKQFSTGLETRTGLYISNFGVGVNIVKARTEIIHAVSSLWRSDFESWLMPCWNSHWLGTQTVRGVDFIALDVCGVTTWFICLYVALMRGRCLAQKENARAISLERATTRSKTGNYKSPG